MSRNKTPLFRRSRHLLCYWRDGQLVFENYLAGTRVSADPIALTILGFFERWRPAGSLARHLGQFDPASVRKAVGELAQHSLLEESGRREPEMTTWREWNPAAGFFHFSTKDVPYESEPSRVARLLRHRLRRQPIPPPVKHYPRARQIRLPSPTADGDFPRVLLARRTWRQFSPQPVSLSDLSTLLKLTWGVQSWLKLPVLGRLALKTSPSGGARHAIEAYVLAVRVAGLAPGLYHYAADSHRLELLRRRASPWDIRRFLPGQPWCARAAALVLMTAVFPRSQWKYRSARAYRVVLLDSGHICQTFCLAATWLGLAPFCTLALADSQIEKALGLDGITESVVYAAGVGMRPAGVHLTPRRRAIKPSARLAVRG